MAVTPHSAEPDRPHPQTPTIIVREKFDIQSLEAIPCRTPPIFRADTKPTVPPTGSPRHRDIPKPPNNRQNERRDAARSVHPDRPGRGAREFPPCVPPAPPRRQC